MYRIIIQIAAKSVNQPTPLKIKRWAKAALAPQIKRGELVIRVVDRSEMQALNKTYRKKDKPTNVLSFRAEQSLLCDLKVPPIGDLVICASVVNEEAKVQAKRPEAHWAHIIIHGCLHLAGYDHQVDHEAMVMEGKEIKLLKKLGFSDPYQLVNKV